MANLFSFDGGPLDGTTITLPDTTDKLAEFRIAFATDLGLTVHTYYVADYTEIEGQEGVCAHMFHDHLNVKRELSERVAANLAAFDATVPAPDGVEPPKE
jgi:hypothetical protein